MKSRILLTSLLLLCLGTTLSRADQFVLFDVTFTFTQEDALNSKPSQSHYYVRGDMINAQRPQDWTAPVDYRNGTVHVRLEVLEKPEVISPRHGACATSQTKARTTATVASAPVLTRSPACMRRIST